LKYIRQELSEEESSRLQQWVQQSKQNQSFFEDTSNVNLLMEDVRAYAEAKQLDQEAMWAKMKALGWELPVADEPKKVVSMNWWRYVAAAVLLAVVSLVVLYVVRKPIESSKPAVVQTPVPADANPNSRKAILTLDNGSSIVLDSLQSGLLATEGNTKVVRQQNGVLSYSGGHGTGDKVLYNTVTVPRGCDVVYLQLSDQTKVWLNAGSSIRYPVAFNSDERKVEITGEAYFEVATLPLRSGQHAKFIVSKGSMNVVVLGTRFNINAYENEADIKVTLLEGSVKVQSEQGERTIKPGQQAVLSDASIKVMNEVDVEQVMAWKDGKFVFNNTNIQMIMRQMERWYDLDPTRYESDAVKKWAFNGEISRYNNASKILQLLEKTGSVTFKVEGRRITVTPL
jgi:transmembrane sensor